MVSSVAKGIAVTLLSGAMAFGGLAIAPAAAAMHRSGGHGGSYHGGGRYRGGGRYYAGGYHRRYGYGGGYGYGGYGYGGPYYYGGYGYPGCVPILGLVTGNYCY